MLSNCGFYLGHYGSHIIKTVEPVRIPWRKCVGVFKQMVNLVGFRTQVLLWLQWGSWGQGRRLGMILVSFLLLKAFVTILGLSSACTTQSWVWDFSSILNIRSLIVAFAALVQSVLCVHSFSHAWCGFSCRIEGAFLPDLFSFGCPQVSPAYGDPFYLFLWPEKWGFSWNFSYLATALVRLHDWGLFLNQSHMRKGGTWGPPHILWPPEIPFSSPLSRKCGFTQSFNCLCC